MKDNTALRNTIKVIIENDDIASTIKNDQESLKLRTASRHTRVFTDDIIESCRAYVSSISSGSRNSSAARELKESLERLQSYITWLYNNNVTWAHETEKFLEIAQTIEVNSSFWKTPKFVNVDQRVEKLQAAVKKLTSCHHIVRVMTSKV